MKYYTFLVENILEYCEIIDIKSMNSIDDTTNIIQMNKRYKLISFASDENGPFFMKKIPYHALSPILEVEKGRLVMLYYYLMYNTDSNIITIHDDVGVCDIQEMDSLYDHHRNWESHWLMIEDINYVRNSKIDDILK